MKMNANKGVITVRGNQQLARDIERGVASGQRNVHLVEADKKPPPIKEPKKVPLDKLLPDRQVTISAALEPEEERELLEFLNKNKDVFSWSANDLRIKKPLNLCFHYCDLVIRHLAKFLFFGAFIFGSMSSLCSMMSRLTP